jgi:hypothetical protein
VRLIIALSLAPILCPVAAIPVAAQAHQQAQTQIIDGSKTPEMIPDSVAYRLYFVTVASQASAVQRAQLTTAGLSPDEIQAASKILAEFKSKWESLTKSYNQSVDASEAIGIAPDWLGFDVKSDRLVANTRDDLRRVLSATGVQSFDAHVEREKKNMKISGATNMK